MTREPAEEPKPNLSTRRVDWDQLWTIFKEDLNFRKYVTAAVITTLGMMAVGFLTVYALERWQVSNSQVGTFTILLLVGQGLGYLLFGWLSDRVGHKVVLEIGTLMNVVSLGIAIFANTPQVFYLVFVMQGINNAAGILSGINIVFEFCSADLRPTYIGLSNTVTGIFSGLAPIIGGVLIEQLNYTWMFGTALVISLAGLAALRLSVTEPRRAN